MGVLNVQRCKKYKIDDMLIYHSDSTPPKVGGKTKRNLSKTKRSKTKRSKTKKRYS